MKKELMLIEKVFEGKQIRTIWNKDEEKFYISVVDIIDVLVKSKDVSGYWRKLKQRLKTIDARKEFTDELQNKGINKAQEFATLTNILTKVWSSYTVKEYKELKNLKKKNLRDNMTNMELVLNMLAEVSSTEISKSSNSSGYNNVKSSVTKGGNVAKNAKEQIEKETGKKIVTSKNNKNINIEKENYRFEIQEGKYGNMIKVNDNFRRLGIDVDKI